LSKIDAQLKVLSEYRRLRSFDSVSGLVAVVDFDSVLSVVNGFSELRASVFTSDCALSMVKQAKFVVSLVILELFTVVLMVFCIFVLFEVFFTFCVFRRL